MTLPPSPNPLPTTEGPKLRDALAWALAELRGETRYDNPQQVAKCFESAYAALSAPTTEGVTQTDADTAAATALTNMLKGVRPCSVGIDIELDHWMPLPPPPGQ